MDGNRNASRQYRAYEDSEARISEPGTSSGATPMTRARFLRSCCGPPLLAATSAPASKALRAAKSGIARTRRQPAA
jgi:hypothetical protein